MPLYEYACQTCDHDFEALVFADEAVECPKCKASDLQRRLSVPARPRAAEPSMSSGCDPNLPPCGPACSRFSG
jgi:putative FmdB family regulatory protein